MKSHSWFLYILVTLFREHGDVMDILVYQEVIFPSSYLSSEILIGRICSLAPNSNCVPSFQLGTIIHNWDLFQHEEKPSHSLSGLRFVGWSTHEMWASRVIVTVTVTVLAYSPWPEGCSSLGVCRGPFSQPPSYCKEGTDKDLHLYFCTYTPFCIAPSA